MLIKETTENLIKNKELCNDRYRYLPVLIKEKKDLLES